MRVLVAVDLKDHPEVTLKAARPWVERLRAQADIAYASPELARIPMDQDDLWSGERAAERSQLEAMLESLPEENRGKARVLVGHAPDVLPPATWDYELVLLSTHARDGLYRLIAGSVAEKVLRRARCPVMTIRLDESK
jgi:nucleotide-binding universal stress UspA family protein